MKPEKTTHAKRAAAIFNLHGSGGHNPPKPQKITLISHPFINRLCIISSSFYTLSSKKHTVFKKNQTFSKKTPSHPKNADFPPMSSLVTGPMPKFYELPTMNSKLKNEKTKPILKLKKQHKPLQIKQLHEHNKIKY